MHVYTCAMVSEFNADPKTTTIKQWLVGSWSDRLLLVMVICAIAWGWFELNQRLSKGPAQVMIYHNQQLLAKYPLQGAAPVYFVAEGDIGDSLVEIANGHVRMTASPCSTQYCVHSGEHRHVGDVVACVPNQILVMIDGDRSGEFDALVE